MIIVITFASFTFYGKTLKFVLFPFIFAFLKVPTPINTSAIKFDFLREKINKNGCCGAAELIKLNSYR